MRNSKHVTNLSLDMVFVLLLLQMHNVADDRSINTRPAHHLAGAHKHGALVS
jgi:hypothetical protein